MRNFNKRMHSVKICMHYDKICMRFEIAIRYLCGQFHYFIAFIRLFFNIFLWMFKPQNILSKIMIFIPAVSRYQTLCQHIFKRVIDGFMNTTVITPVHIQERFDVFQPQTYLFRFILPGDPVENESLV